MTKNGKNIKANALAASALALMDKHRINALVVVNDDDAFVGVLNMHDLLKATSCLMDKKSIFEKAAAIKLAVFDVDGVLTDGKLNPW